MRKSKRARMEFGKMLQNRGYYVVGTQLRNKGRHAIMKATKNGENHYYYHLFKRDFFMSFDDQFGEETGVGVGETINKEWLDGIPEYVEYLVFTYSNGKSYGITPSKFRELGKERTQHHGEITVSIPVKELTNMEVIL